MTIFYKQPTENNQRTGNVCLSLDEFEHIKVCDKLVIVGALGDTEAKIVYVQRYMIDCAKIVDNEYVLFPYVRSSSLVRRRC